MDNPVEQVGSDLADVGRKLGHAVATGASEVKDVLLGKPGPPVPQPPGFDWASTYEGLAKGDTDEYAKQYKAHEEAAKTQAEFQQGQLKEQGLETQLKQLNLDKLTRESEIVKELRGLDMSKPESAGRRKELFEEYALLNGKSLIGGRPRYATGKMLEAAVAGGIDASKDLSEWSEQDWNELLPKGYKIVDTRTTTTSGIDPDTQLPYSRTSTSGHNFSPTDKKSDLTHATPIHPAPLHLGGGNTTSGARTNPRDTADAAIAKTYSTPNIEAAYDRLMRGDTTVQPKLKNAAYVYAQKNNMTLPPVANKNIDGQKKAVEDAEKRLLMMEGDAAHPSGPNDIDLLWAHLGMTAAGQKGVRVTQNIIKEAVNARPIGESWGVRWHKLADGTFLSPEQRANFLDLARRRVEAEKRELAASIKDFGGDQGEVPPPPTDPTQDIPGFIPLN